MDFEAMGERMRNALTTGRPDTNVGVMVIVRNEATGENIIMSNYGQPGKLVSQLLEGGCFKVNDKAERIPFLGTTGEVGKA